MLKLDDPIRTGATRAGAKPDAEEASKATDNANMIYPLPCGGKMFVVVLICGFRLCNPTVLAWIYDVHDGTEHRHLFSLRRSIANPRNKTDDVAYARF
jgi:hypothetical protein